MYILQKEIANYLLNGVIIESLTKTVLLEFLRRSMGNSLALASNFVAKANDTL
jgi:hypothetical protein